MLAAVLGWVLPCQSTPSLLHKRPKGRFGLHAIVLAIHVHVKMEKYLAQKMIAHLTHGLHVSIKEKDMKMAPLFLIHAIHVLVKKGKLDVLKYFVDLKKHHHTMKNE